MSPSNPNSSVFDRLSTTTVLTGSQAAVIKQTYALFGIAVIAGLADDVQISETPAGTSIRMSWPSAVTAS